MDTNKIELTPEQKGVLVALSQETGEPVDALLNKVFEELQERMQTPKKGFKEALRSLGLNWLRVLDTAEMPHINHRVCHQFHRIVPMLDVLKPHQ